MSTGSSASVSYAVVTALAEFFSINLNSTCLDSEATSLTERICNLESVVVQLSKQLSTLEQNLAQKYNTTLQNVVPEKLPDLAAVRQQVQPTLTVDHSIQQPTTLAPEVWARGITTGQLVKRLNTNPTTLKKYLRELKQIQWAVERDPERLGWLYDDLLQCYHPIRVNAESEPSKVDPAINVPLEQQIEQTQSTSVESTPGVNSENCQLPLPQGGLTQSQLSRLTGIPITSLQRWKELPDCTERIRCRTEGHVFYWYSGQNRRFYPLTI